MSGGRWLLFACCAFCAASVACSGKGGAHLQSGPAPATRVATVLRGGIGGLGGLVVTDVVTHASALVAVGSAPARPTLVEAVLAGDAPTFFVLAQAPLRLLGWTFQAGALGMKPDKALALPGFVPSGFSANGAALLIFSEDASSTVPVAIWALGSGQVLRLAPFSAPDLVPACACAVPPNQWLVVGTAPVRSATSSKDQYVLLDDGGAVRGLLGEDQAEIALQATFNGPLGCVTDPASDRLAIVFGDAVAVLQFGADGLQPLAKVALPGAALGNADRVRPVFQPQKNALVVPTRSSPDQLLVPLDGGAVSTFRATTSGDAMAAGLVPDSDGVLLGLGGAAPATVVLHFFDGSDDIPIVQLSASDDLVDMVVLTSQ